MFGIAHFEIFLVTCLVVNVTPGSDTIYLLSRSIAQGRTAGLYSMLGISSGCAVHTILAALGLSAILAQSATAFLGVKIIGALYLGYLGITTLRADNSPFSLVTADAMSARATYLQGLLTNVLNPKVALFFLSFLPQFIEPQNGYGVMPFFLLGLTFVVTSSIWLLILVAFSAGITAFLRENHKVGKRLNTICGGIYLLLGAKLLTAER